MDIVYKKYSAPELDLAAKVVVSDNTYKPEDFVTAIVGMLGEIRTDNFSSTKALYNVERNSDALGTYVEVHRHTRSSYMSSIQNDPIAQTHESYIPSIFHFEVDKYICSGARSKSCLPYQGYLRNDVEMIKNTWSTSLKKWYLPQPKQVMTNSKNGKDYVTVVWKDGTHTVICRAEGEEYDIEKAIMYAVLKKMCGDNGCEMNRYFEKFKKCQGVSGEKGV